VALPHKLCTLRAAACAQRWRSQGVEAERPTPCIHAIGPKRDLCVDDARVPSSITSIGSPVLGGPPEGPRETTQMARLRGQKVAAAALCLLLLALLPAVGASARATRLQRAAAGTVPLFLC